MRVVTADGTRCSLLAARITPPSSTTLLNTCRSAKFMARGSVQINRIYRSYLFNIIEHQGWLYDRGKKRGRCHEHENTSDFRRCRRLHRAFGVGERHGHRALLADADPAA